MDSASLSGAPSSAAPAPRPATASFEVPRAAAVENRQAIEQTLGDVSQDVRSALPENTRYRTRLHFDQETARVVAEIVDKDSGAVVDSFPPDLILGFIARTRDALGPMVNVGA